MRWIKRIGITLVLAIVALVGGVYLFGPPVNVPIGGMLASRFPDLTSHKATTSSLEAVASCSLSGLNATLHTTLSSAAILVLRVSVSRFHTST